MTPAQYLEALRRKQARERKPDVDEDYHGTESKG